METEFPKKTDISEAGRLREALEAKDRDARLAAQFGKELLESNTQLNAQLNQVEEQSQRLQSKIEAIEQEKFNLKQEVARLTSLTASQQEENEIIEKNWRRDFEKLKQDAEFEKCQALQKLKCKLEEVQEQLDDSKIKLLEYQKKAEVQLQTIEQLKEQLDQHMNVSSLSVTSSEEILKLQENYNKLAQEKAVLQEELATAKCDLHSTKLRNIQAERALTELKEDLSEAQARATSYCNEVEKCRETMLELQVQVDNMHLEQVDTKKKGNSLFAEVNDRRLQLEERVTALAKDKEMLCNKYNLAKQHLSKLRLELASMISLCSQRANASQMQRLQMQIQQQLSEIQDLHCSVDALRLERAGLIEQLMTFTPDNYDEKNFVDFLKASVERERAEKQELESQLKSKSSEKLVESKKLFECESRLYESECINSRLRSEILQLTAKLQCAKEDNMSSPFAKTEAKVPNRGITEKIPPASVELADVFVLKETNPPSKSTKLVPEKRKADEPSDRKDTDVTEKSSKKTKKVSFDETMPDTIITSTDSSDISSETTSRTEEKTEFQKRGGKVQRRVVSMHDNKMYRRDECKQQ